MLDRLDEMLSKAGLFVRGGFHPDPADGVPPLADGAPARTVLLAGNAGPAMWRAFAAEADRRARHPLDDWLRPRLEAAAAACGAEMLLPNAGPPYPPVLDWAVRAEPVYRSPIGTMIHPDFGLWHVYRAAFLFAARLDLPPRDDRPSPCDSCEAKPCLSVCPADAFRPDRFDARACVGHVESAGGTACRSGGCLARRACPAGRGYRYVPEQQAFHTAAMVRAAKRIFEA
jgi:hypothetical protein